MHRTYSLPYAHGITSGDAPGLCSWLYNQEPLLATFKENHIWCQNQTPELVYAMQATCPLCYVYGPLTNIKPLKIQLSPKQLSLYYHLSFTKGTKTWEKNSLFYKWCQKKGYPRAKECSQKLILFNRETLVSSRFNDLKVRAKEKGFLI